MAATKRRWSVGRRTIPTVDVKEILVQREAGRTISGIAHTLGYSHPTARVGERIQ